MQPTTAPDARIQATLAALKLRLIDWAADCYLIEGETYPHRDALRAYGGKWDNVERAWKFKTRAAAEFAVTSIEAELKMKAEAAPRPEPKPAPVPRRNPRAVRTHCNYCRRRATAYNYIMANGSCKECNDAED